MMKFKFVNIAMFSLFIGLFQGCGKTGSTGPAGAPGAEGSAGPAGAAGPQGDPGPSMQVGSSGLNFLLMSQGNTSGTLAIVVETFPAAGWTCTVWADNSTVNVAQTSACTIESTSRTICYVSCAAGQDYDIVKFDCINPADNLYQAVTFSSVTPTEC